MRIREDTYKGRRMVEIRVGPAILTLDDVEDLLVAMEESTGGAAALTVDGLATRFISEISEVADYQITGRPALLDVLSEDRSHALVRIRLKRDMAWVSVDRELPEARDIAVALARLIERRRSFLPYLTHGMLYFYVLAPAVTGVVIALITLWFGAADLAIWGIPVTIWGPVVVVLAMANQFFEYRRRFGGGVWLIPVWRVGPAR